MAPEFDSLCERVEETTFDISPSTLQSAKILNSYMGVKQPNSNYSTIKVKEPNVPNSVEFRLYKVRKQDKYTELLELTEDGNCKFEYPESN